MMIKKNNRSLLIPVLLICGMVVAVYCNSIYNEFSNWDDQMVTENKTIRSLSISKIKNLFTPRKGATYQPVRTLSYAIDYYFWKLNPVGYHLTNIALHMGAAVLLYLFLLKIMPKILYAGDGNQEQTIKSITNEKGRKRKKKKSRKMGLDTEQNGPVLIDFYRSDRYVALFTALLFAVHPICVESVTWIAGRKYVLLAFFSFAALYLFAMALEKAGKKYFILSFIAWILAVLSSPFGVILPVLFFLVDYAGNPSINPFAILKQQYKIYLPYIFFYTLAALLFWYTILGGTGSGGTVFRHYDNNPMYTFWTMFRVLFDYMRNLIMPVWLNCRYVDWISTSYAEVKIICTGIGLVAIISWIIFELNKGKKITLFCFAWFFISLAPTMNIIPISTMMADRYIYIAAVGVFLLLSSTAVRWAMSKTRKTRMLFCVFAGVLIVWLSFLTIERNTVWANSKTLWADSLKKDPENLVAHGNYGIALFDDGQYKKAILHFKKTLRLAPKDAEAYLWLGKSMLELNRIDAAIVYFKKALAIRSNDGRALRALDKAYEKKRTQ